MRPDAAPGGLQRLQVAIATGFGIGYAPVAPGTVGSLPGLLLYWLLYRAGGWPAVLPAVALVIGVGIWAANAAERRFQRKDPGAVIIDEVAGQLVTLIGFAPSPTMLVAGFFLFRLFDILKPFPARRLEGLPGGSGIMMDDLVAGVYANLALHGVVWLLARGGLS